MKSAHRFSFLLLVLLVIGCHPFGSFLSFGRDVVLSESKAATFAVPYDDFVRTPIWEPGRNPNPLPTEEAVAIALEEFKRSSGFNDGIVLDISLRRVFNSEYGNRWYYNIRIIPVQNGEPQFMKAVDPVFILMDRTIVKKRK